MEWGKEIAKQFKLYSFQTINSESEDVDNICVESKTGFDQSRTGFDPKELMPLYTKTALRKFSQEPKRNCMDIIEEASV